MRTLDKAWGPIGLGLACAWIPTAQAAGRVAAGPPPPPTAQEPAAPRPRSVLFYLIDTCRDDRMGFNGYERETTPFLAWLAERSVVFEACYSQAAWTKPSMASMLCSRYPSSTGVYKLNQRLPEAFVTWPEVLQANGMYTAGFSANIVMGDFLSNFAQGFDHFVESLSVNQGDPIRFASGSARKLNEHAFAWLDRSDRWPMLLYMHSVDPHEEYEPEPAYLEQFADPERHPRFRQEWQKLLDSRPPIPGLYVTQDDFDQVEVDSTSFIEHASNLYDADILANDDQLQRLWDRLQADGWGEDLIVVVTSDHGEEFFEHGGTSHGYSLYDEMIRVPLLIHAPGLLPAGKRIETPVRSLDIYPTLCELLGFDAPEWLHGESLVPLIREQAAAPAPAVFSEHREDPIVRRIGHGSGVLVSLRSGRWKLILNETSSQLIERPPRELYDLEEDPREERNVAARHPEVVARLEREIAELRAKHLQKAGAGAARAIDPAVLEQLRALGYVGDEEEEPDLWTAVKSGDVEAAGRSLRAGADPDQLDEEFGVSPLSMAALTGNVELARALLAAGGAVDVRNHDGATPLSGAAFLGHAAVLRLLLERGADPGARTLNGDTALGATAAPWELTRFIADLLMIPVDRGAVEAGRRECAGILEAWSSRAAELPTGLFEAIRRGDPAAIERALRAGASLKAWDRGTGRTPLYEAVMTGREAVVRLLLERGASVHARNRDMASALHAAALRGDPGLVETLIGRGAYLDARDAKGTTALHAAAFLGRAEIVERLLRGGADPAMEDQAGQTALDATRAEWQITELSIRVLGLELQRDEVEAGRAAVAELLHE